MFHIRLNVGDMVWVETTEYSASRARITGTHTDGYYVNFIDKTSEQEPCHDYPVMSRKVKPIDYIGLEK